LRAAAAFNSTREREEKTAKKKKKNNILNIYIYNPFFSFSTFLVLMSCPCFGNIFLRAVQSQNRRHHFSPVQIIPQSQNPPLFLETPKTPMLINIANLNIVKTNRFFSGLYIINILNLDSTFYPPFQDSAIKCEQNQ
jgi:hypothetical protein